MRELAEDAGIVFSPWHPTQDEVDAITGLATEDDGLIALGDHARAFSDWATRRRSYG